MTGTYQILQTKIKELETILEEAILRGLESHSHEDIKTKLSFIQTLLSAEVASSDSTKPHHDLFHMSDRLVSLEKSFHEWDTQRTFTTEDFEKDNSISSCSCTESCFNNDGEETLEDKDSGMTIYDNPLVEDSWNFDGEKAIVESRENGVGEICENEKERFNLENDDKVGFFVYEDVKDELFEDFVKDDKKVIVESVESVDSELGSEEEDGSGKSGVGKNCCALTKGVVIGMILMGFIMVNFSDCFYYYDEEASFAFPT